MSTAGAVALPNASRPLLLFSFERDAVAGFPGLIIQITRSHSRPRQKPGYRAVAAVLGRQSMPVPRLQSQSRRRVRQLRSCAVRAGGRCRYAGANLENYIAAKVFFWSR